MIFHFIVSSELQCSYCMCTMWQAGARKICIFHFTMLALWNMPDEGINGDSLTNLFYPFSPITLWEILQCMYEHTFTITHMHTTAQQTLRTWGSSHICSVRGLQTGKSILFISIIITWGQQPLCAFAFANKRKAVCPYTLNLTPIQYIEHFGKRVKDHPIIRPH